MGQNVFDLGKGMDKRKALDSALAQIERSFGKGSIMKLGERQVMDIEAVSTGSLGLDIASMPAATRQQQITFVRDSESIGEVSSNRIATPPRRAGQD